jgi:hypothetical protein
MLFVGYADDHTGNCYRMYNPVTSGVNVTRDIIWLGRMYFTTVNCEKTKVLPVIAVPITNDVTNKDLSVKEITKMLGGGHVGTSKIYVGISTISLGCPLYSYSPPPPPSPTP